MEKEKTKEPLLVGALQIIAAGAITLGVMYYLTGNEAHVAEAVAVFAGLILLALAAVVQKVSRMEQLSISKGRREEKATQS